MGLFFTYLNKSGISDFFYILSALIALGVGFSKLLDILRHGYYGIPVLTLIGILTALFLKQTEAAALLAIVISIEQSAFAWFQRNLNKKVTLLQAKHAPFVRLLDVASLPFTVLILLIAGAVWTISGDVSRFLEVVVSASTVPLLLIAPLGITKGLNALRLQGLNISTAQTIEKLAEIKSVVLRKSGVLTEQEVQVSSVQTLGKHSKSEVLTIAAALAGKSTHRLAKAVVMHTSKSLKVEAAKHTHETIGQGIIGRMKGQDIIIGRASFLAAHDITVPNSLTGKGGPEICVAQNGELLGVITFKETMLGDAKKLTQGLRKLGMKHIELISSSASSAVAASAKQSNITSYLGDVETDDAIRLIHDMKERPVAYIGTGIHDEAIATAADLSFSVLPNDVVSSITINDYSPTKLLAAFTLAKKTMRTAQLAVSFSLIIYLLLILLAATGKLSSVQAAGLNLGLTVVILVFCSVKPMSAKHSQL